MIYKCVLHLFPPSITHIFITGSFSGNKKHEVVIAKGHIIELLSPNDSESITSITSLETFGVIRSLTCFRLPGKSDSESTH
jgi:splicing factor 3B subunit 3